MTDTALLPFSLNAWLRSATDLSAAPSAEPIRVFALGAIALRFVPTLRGPCSNAPSGSSTAPRASSRRITSRRSPHSSSIAGYGLMRTHAVSASTAPGDAHEPEMFPLGL